jgi:hypothetical protein
MAGKLSGSAIQTGTITSTQLSTELGPVSSELQLVGSGVSLNVSNTAVFTGNVGIGTTNPTAKLFVASSETGYAANLAETVTKSAVLFKTHNSDSTVTSFGGISNGIAYIQRSNGPGTGPYAICLNPFGGDVGIGTTNPVNSSGYTQITLNNATNGGGFHLQHNGNTAFSSAVDSSSVYLDFPTTRPVRFFQNGSEAMRLANGNFGIGTTAPEARLVVEGRAQIGKTDNRSYMFLSDAISFSSGTSTKYITFSILNAGVAMEIQLSLRGIFSAFNADGVRRYAIAAGMNTTDTNVYGAGITEMYSLGGTSTYYSVGTPDKPNATTYRIPVTGTSLPAGDNLFWGMQIFGLNLNNIGTITIT